MVKPVSPAEIPEVKKGTLPDDVKRVWNDFIAKKYANGRAVIEQDEIIPVLMDAMGTLDRKVVFANKWLDIEEIYENAGWCVVYSKPSYSETFPATFTFTPKG